MISLLTWLIIGGIVGWLAGIIMRDNNGVLVNIIVGIVGAFIGGLILARGDINNSPLTLGTFAVSLLGAVVQDETGMVIDEGDLAVPTSEIEIKDDWFVAGLQGTGSSTMVAKDVRVPAHRFLSLPALMQRQTAPYGVADDEWFSRAQPVPVLSFCLVGGTLGMARAAMEEFRRTVKGKRILYTSNHIADEWIPIKPGNRKRHFALRVVAPFIIRRRRHQAATLGKRRLEHA